ncbi:MAG: Fe-S cluster assembly protein SufD [Myxococcota bacterium]
MSPALESLARLALARARDAAPAWIERLREEAAVVAREQGLPSRRLEAWKGTSLAKLEALDFVRVGPGAEPARPDAQPARARATAETPDDAIELVFVDGRFEAFASRTTDLPEGVSVRSLAELLVSEPEALEGRLGTLAEPKGPSLVALQTSWLEDGAVVAIDRDVQLATPIRLRFLATADAADAPSAAFPRLLVVAGRGSQATLFQDFACEGDAPGLTNFVAELHIEAGARLEAIELQRETAPRVHVTQTHARLERDARLDSTVLSLGTGLVRSELSVALAEPGAKTRMAGFFLGREDDHVDHYTTVDHAAPHCTSVEEYRGVLDDHSKGVFRGRVIVRPGAQKTDAKQSNPNLLLSDRATIDTKPQLEIYADDVKASHGSTIGQLDAEALFFLRARGIDEARARLMLTRAFAHSVVDGVGEAAIREELRERVDAALATTHGALDTEESV